MTRTLALAGMSRARMIMAIEQARMAQIATESTSAQPAKASPTAPDPATTNQAFDPTEGMSRQQRRYALRRFRKSAMKRQLTRQETELLKWLLPRKTSK